MTKDLTRNLYRGYTYINTVKRSAVKLIAARVSPVSPCHNAVHSASASISTIITLGILT